MSNLLVLVGHPERTSFNAALAESYVRGASANGAAVRTIHLAELRFDPVLRGAFRTPMPLEPDLEDARAAIEAADHVAWFFPTWWGGSPAVVKGFVDRLFLPGWAFRHHPGKTFHEKLLVGRSARLVTTMDAPSFWYALVYLRSVHASFETATLDYVGFSPIHTTTLYEVRSMDARARERALGRAFEDGARDASRLAKRAPKRSPRLATPR